MKLSERIERLYFKKYDDQMGGLTTDEEQELYLINIVLDSPRAEKIYDDLLKMDLIKNE